MCYFNKYLMNEFEVSLDLGINGTCQQPTRFIREKASIKYVHISVLTTEEKEAASFDCLDTVYFS